MDDERQTMFLRLFYCFLPLTSYLSVEVFADESDLLRLAAAAASTSTQRFCRLRRRRTMYFVASCLAGVCGFQLTSIKSISATHHRVRLANAVRAAIGPGHTAHGRRRFQIYAACFAFS